MLAAKQIETAVTGARQEDLALDIAPVFSEARSRLPVALYGLADLRMSAGKLAEARQILQRALELSPGDAPSLRGLGRVALMQGDAATATTAAALAQTAASPPQPH